MSIEVHVSERGFQRLEIPPEPEGYYPLKVCQSSVILDYEGSLDRAGSSALWIGNKEGEAHLGRDGVADLVVVLQHWLKTGSLDLGVCPTCGLKGGTR